MCGEPLKKGSTACSCGYKESLADRELLRRLERGSGLSPEEKEELCRFLLRYLAARFRP